MSDILIHNNPMQSTSLGSTRFDQFILGNVYQGSSQACIVDLTPPTFAGIVSLSIQSLGQFRATWAAATDISLPILYEVFIQEATAVNLFNPSNIIGITNKFQLDIFETPNGSFLNDGSTYYVGVRARDGIGNIDNNTVSISLVAPGINVMGDDYEPRGVFSLGNDNKIYGTFWILKNHKISSGVTLGLGAYEIYDKAGTLIMSESNLVADSFGSFRITPTASLLSTNLDHYVIKLKIFMDFNLREGYVSVVERIPEYEIRGSFALNPSNQIIATFWASIDDELIANPGQLGTASYTIYDNNGVAVPLMLESGITPDSNGLFKITPVTSALATDLTFYSAKVTINVNNVDRTNFLPILGKIPKYEARGQFSINALNQFQATFWATIDGIVKTGANLGVANYTVYDKDGIAVAGLTQSGLVADSNGRFQITPVSAILLTDLTHYSVKIGIVVDNVERISYRGFTLLGS
jgi:hypothetical protein